MRKNRKKREKIFEQNIKKCSFGISMKNSIIDIIYIKIGDGARNAEVPHQRYKKRLRQWFPNCAPGRTGAPQSFFRCAP